MSQHDRGLSRPNKNKKNRTRRKNKITNHAEEEEAIQEVPGHPLRIQIYLRGTNPSAHGICGIKHTQLTIPSTRSNSRIALFRCMMALFFFLLNATLVNVWVLIQGIYSREKYSVLDDIAESNSHTDCSRRTLRN